MKGLLNQVLDFPRKGITFQDISPLIADPDALAELIAEMCAPYKDVDLVAGAEARGFLFATAMALQLGAGVIMLRKPNKLPSQRLVEHYGVEYREKNAIELQMDLIRKGQRVVVVDDLLATGGTAVACCKLVKRAGGEIAGICFAVELEELGGRKKLEKYGDVRSVIKIKKT